MEAKELRIGNWVNYEGENIQLFLSQIGEFLEDAHELKPIPLTVDWLLKFGFNYKNGALRIGDFTVHNHKNFMYYYSNGGLNNGGVILKHVHQLQNLYFALTNKELTI